MIRVLVGDTRAPYGFYALDETDPAAKVEITAFEYADGRSRRTEKAMRQMLYWLRNPGETDAELLLVLPTRLSSYQWAALITAPHTSPSAPKASAV
jgi:hypothetical protein